MGLDLYYLPGSVPCRAVMLTAKALNLDLNMIVVDLHTGEHLKPEFVKLNPQHTVPVLVDDGLILAESRAILAYLVNKYGKGSSLYPEEPKARALVDQRLYFDIGNIHKTFSEYFYPYAFYGTPIDKEKESKFEDALKILEKFLEGQKYVTGSNLTIADLSLIPTLSSLEFTDIDIKKYPNVNRWLETVKSTAAGYQEIDASEPNLVKDYLQRRAKK